MNGSLSIGAEAGRWNEPVTQRVLVTVAIGVLAGIAVAVVRQPLHLPGHKVIWWLAPILATRLRTRVSYGATLATAASVCTTALLGGRMPGGDLLFPFAVASGLLLDWSIIYLDKNGRGFPARMFWLCAASAAGNLLCLLTRVSDAGSTGVAFRSSREIAVMTASFAGFGLAAGAVGCLIGTPIKRLGKP